MKKISASRERLIIRICQMYYQENLTQKEIAAAVGLSRPQISRILESAQKRGIVQITIRNPYSEEFACETALEKRFPGQSVVVINTTGLPPEAALAAFAAPVAHILEEVLPPGGALGVQGGETVAALSHALNSFSCPGLTIVPLAGGLGPEGSARQSNQIAKVLGERLACKYLQMYSPACLASEAARDLMIQEPEISCVIERARHVQGALVGIGQISATTTIGYFPNITRQDIDELAAAGAVAVLGPSFLDSAGRCVPTPIYRRMVGITAAELRQVPHVIAVACGKAKAEAIAAVLRSGCIDTLVTDLETAQDVLALG